MCSRAVSHSAPKRYLEDIALLRLVLILMLVVHHSFAPYSDAWVAFPGMQECSVYQAIASVTRTMMLPVFVFISGYLYGYSILSNPARLSIQGSVFSKAKRLLLPSLLFSVLYVLLFFDWSAAPLQVTSVVLIGAGHLWFLPMLFCCFMACFLVARVKRHGAVMLFACVLAIYPPPFATTTSITLLNMPLMVLRKWLEAMSEYFVFFYLGFLCGRKLLARAIERTKTPRCLMLCVLAFLIAKVGLTIVNRNVLSDANDFPSMLSLNELLKNLCTLICGLSAVGLMYGGINRFLVGKVKLNRALIKLSGYCFGVYIYQQFILMGLYYHTSVPSLLPSALIPWVMTLATLAFSLLLTWLTLRTSWGRYLIG